MFIIGVTGSIGSGKSTVARMLGDLIDAPVVDADAIAREVVMPGKEALIHIIETFGSNMVDKDGSLRRKELGDLIFANTHARKALNKIMFPFIRERATQHFNAHAIVGRKFLIYDAPLLFESRSFDLVDYIVLVHVPRDVQIERIMDRNGLTSKEATDRVDAQPSGDDLKKLPIDYLIQNTSDYIGLNGMVEKCWKNIQAKKKQNALDRTK